MKKLLYTLILGLTFVACDKDNQFDDAPEALAIENVSVKETKNVLDNNDILEIVSSVLNMDIKKGSTRGLHSTFRKGADRITMHLFLADTVIYTTYLDESNDDLCIEADDATFLSSVHLNNQNGQIEVTLGDDNNVLNIVEGDFTSLFSVPLNLLLKLDDGNVVGRTIFNDDNIATFATE